MSARAYLRRHKSQPGVSAEAYRQRRLRAFRTGLGHRKAIYLDVNYWIELQKAAAGQATRGEYDALLTLLRQGVAGGRIMCPPSAALMMEFGKQSDVETRVATGRLVDELCCGAGLLADDELVAEEIARLLLSSLAPVGPPSERTWVWTPIGCMVAGNKVPELPIRRTPQQQNRDEKAYLDTLMDVTAADALARDLPVARSPWIDLAKQLNEGSAEFAHEVTTFDALLATEARGAAEAAAPMVVRALEVLRRELAAPDGVALDPAQWINLVGVASGKSSHAKAQVPSLYVQAGLHALLRWNRRQKFKPNDILDFTHAAGALGHCDLFLTEGPLKDLLGRGPLRLAEASNCQVCAAPPEAVEAVRALVT